MGFFTNIGNEKAVKLILAEDTIKFIKENGKNIFVVRGNTVTSAPELSYDGDAIVNNLESQMRRAGDNEAIEKIKLNNQYFTITDNNKVMFHAPMCFYKINELPPFNADNSNMLILKACGDAMMDWLPESLQILNLLNTHRKSGEFGFKNLKFVNHLIIAGDTHAKSLKGLEDLKVYCLSLKNCTKLTTTSGAPIVGTIPTENPNHSSIKSYTVLPETASVSISSCKELQEIDIQSKKNIKVNVFITEKTCPKINKVTSLPDKVGFIGCKNLSSGDFKDIKSEIDYIEICDFKGKGSELFNRHLSSREEVVEKLKKMVDELVVKHWRVFDDLAAVLTFYGLDEYAKIEKSEYVQNGMIRCYSCMVDRGGRYNHDFVRDNIKKGVTRYLNQLGVQYKIINTDPKKSKDYEYIQITNS